MQPWQRDAELQRKRDSGRWYVADDSARAAGLVTLLAFKGLKLREGFKQPIDRNNIFETLRDVDMKQHPENAIPLLPSIERISIVSCRIIR